LAAAGLATAAAIFGMAWIIIHATYHSRYDALDQQVQLQQGEIDSLQAASRRLDGDLDRSRDVIRGSLDIRLNEVQRQNERIQQAVSTLREAMQSAAEFDIDTSRSQDQLDDAWGRYVGTYDNNLEAYRELHQTFIDVSVQTVTALDSSIDQLAEEHRRVLVAADRQQNDPPRSEVIRNPNGTMTIISGVSIDLAARARGMERDLRGARGLRERTRETLEGWPDASPFDHAEMLDPQPADDRPASTH
jgi:hypothetical protein